MSGLFKSKQAPQATIEKVYDPFEGIRGRLNDYFNANIGKSATPYTGEFVAPASEAENRSQATLKEYSDDQSYKEGYKLSKDELKKTLTDQYDPSTSPYYQAVKASAMRNQDKALETVANKASMGRRYYGGGRLKEQGDVLTDTTNSLNVTLGSMAEKERQNRLTAAGLLPGIEDKELAIPLQKTAANQAYGALPREIEQAYNDAVYNEFLNATREYPLNIAQLATGLGAREPLFAKTNAPKKQDTAGGILDFITTLFGGM